MTIRMFVRHLREGVKSLGRNGWMTFASLSGVAVTLLIVGVFIVMALNVQGIAQQVEQQVEIDVMLNDSATGQAITDIHQRIERLDGVQSVKYVSKQQGLAQLKAQMKEYSDVLSGLDSENPLPNEFVVHAVNPRLTPEIATQIQKLPQVHNVKYARDTVQKLFRVTTIIRDIGVVFIVGLVLTAMFLISNTIKITIFARRREIEIMKLVGATNGFIRWPFFIEGLLIGLLGSALPICIVAIGYQTLFHSWNIDVFRLLPTQPLTGRVSLLMLTIGAFIGVWGSFTSVRKFLRV